MTDHNSIPSRTGSFRAAVRAGSDVTEYTRSGAGRPILLLLRKSGNGNDFRTSIQEAIAASFRVIAPEQIPDSGEFASWLAGFQDGLGLTQTSIVADDEYGLAVFGFALLEPSRVDRLVLLSQKGPGYAELDGTLAVPTESGSHPVLIVRPEPPVEDVAAKVVRFLLNG